MKRFLILAALFFVPTLCSGQSVNPLKCSAFYTNDWSTAIASCFADAYAKNATAMVLDATGIPPGTGTVNPFTAAANIPASGILQMGCGVFLTPVPIVVHPDWTIQGCAVRGVAGQVGTTIEATGSFQTTYTTGTITVGTPGASEVITGSGTTWTSNMIGCAFYGNNGTTNSTGGIITAVGSATSLTLGWGWNNGTGAAAASNYSIACPVYVLGSGGASAAGAIYGMGVFNMNFDCNAIAGCIGLLNYFGQQGTQGNNVAVHNSLNIGFDFENQIQNMGKWTNLLASMGTGCGAGALPVVIRGFSGGESFFGISGLSAGKGNCATTLTQDIDLEGNYVSMSALDVASAGIGVLLGGNVTCPISCAVPGHMPSGNHIDNIYAENTVTTAVKISNTLGTGQSNQISQVTNLGTNALIDTANGCTETNSQLASYITTVTGVIGFSTSTISGCTSAYTQTIASGTVALGTSSISSGSCDTTGVGVTATGVAATDTMTYAANTDISGVTGYGSTSGFLTIYPYPGSSVVNFKVCNWTGSSITPSAVTLNWRVVR